MLYTTRNTCRLCEGQLNDIISLGNIYVSTFLDTYDAEGAKIPLDLVSCDLCGLVQLRHTTSGKVMYDDYWYQSGLNSSMVSALQDIVSNVLDRIHLSDNDIVVDIGSNDGTLLSFYPRYLQKIGFEPSNLATVDKNKCNTIVNDYFTKETYEQISNKKARVITAIAMFYDLENPHTFVQDLYDILDDDGIIVIQMMDLLSMMKFNDFTNICHEHLEYYTLKLFEEVLAAHNLQIFDIEYNKVNGGSLRAYICKIGKRIKPARVIEAIQVETIYFEELGNLGEYLKNMIEDVKTKVVTKVNEINTEGKTVAVMGASTKGNTVLQYFGLTPKDIIHAAEVNPDKFGKYTVGSGIPIISQQESMRHFVDYYLILPWGFIDNFVERNKEYLMSGGAFIVPLPQPRVITMDAEGNTRVEIL